MNTQSFTLRPRFALALLGGEYILLGWFLAAHHLFWLIGSCIVVLTFTIIWKRNPLLSFLSWFANQQILVAIGVSFLISLLIAFIFIKPILISLSLLPFATLMYAVLELQTAQFKQSDILLWSLVITGLGLGVGEAIDLLITPSMRF